MLLHTLLNHWEQSALGWFWYFDLEQRWHHCLLNASSHQGWGPTHCLNCCSWGMLEVTKIQICFLMLKLDESSFSSINMLKYPEAELSFSNPLHGGTFNNITFIPYFCRVKYITINLQITIHNTIYTIHTKHYLTHKITWEVKSLVSYRTLVISLPYKSIAGSRLKETIYLILVRHRLA